ncbi:hypothetical protein [Pseudonocardia sp.]|uniref:hypothetical protein n=1 Tax=Pseudonocardia sp. TaxID=60912 RepID=UPI003D0F3739
MTVGIQQLMWEIERIHDAFHQAVHVDGDVDAAFALVTEDVTVTHLPAGTGAAGPDLRRHLARDVLGHLPADLAFKRVSRTTDKLRVVDENVVTFTHDRELPWLLPGVAPTHRRAEVLAISVTAFRHARVNAHRTESRLSARRTLWDQQGLAAQLGL